MANHSCLAQPVVVQQEEFVPQVPQAAGQITQVNPTPAANPNEEEEEEEEEESDKEEVTEEPDLQQEEDNEFTCSICHNLFVEPVTVPCGWTYCKACLQANIIERTGRPLAYFCQKCKVNEEYNGKFAVNQSLAVAVKRKKRIMEVQRSCCHECGHVFMSTKNWFVCIRCSTKESELLLCSNCIAHKHSMHPTRKAKGITKVERQTVLEKMDEIVSGAQKELEEVHKERKKIEEEYNDYERAATQFLNVLRRTRTTIEKSPYVRRQSVDRLIKIRSAQSDLITKTCGSKRLPRAFNLESGRALRLLSEIRTLHSADGIGRELTTLISDAEQPLTQTTPQPPSDPPTPQLRNNTLQQRLMVQQSFKQQLLQQQTYYSAPQQSTETIPPMYGGPILGQLPYNTPSQQIYQ